MLLHKILRMVERFFRSLGGKSILRLAGALGWAMRILLPARRKYANKTIQERLGLPLERAEEVTRASFRNNALSFLEIFQTRDFPLRDNPRLLPWPAEFQAILDSGRPVVAATAHLGAWELLAGLLGDFNPERPHLVVVRKQRNPSVNEWIRGLREARGAKSVDHRNAAPVVLDALRQGGVAAFLVDHNCNRREAVFLPFLGRDAAVNVGPALLALRGKALVVPVFLLRTENGAYSLNVHKALDTTALTGGISERVKAIAEFYTRAVEREVRLCPEQWFWMHKRWKTRPPGEPGDSGV